MRNRWEGTPSAMTVFSRSASERHLFAVLTCKRNARCKNRGYRMFCVRRAIMAGYQLTSNAPGATRARDIVGRNAVQSLLWAMDSDGMDENLCG
jgi:hypothetical protein